MTLLKRYRASDPTHAPACTTEVYLSTENPTASLPLISIRPRCCQPQRSLSAILKPVSEIILQAIDSREHGDPIQMT